MLYFDLKSDTVLSLSGKDQKKSLYERVYPIF